MHALIGCLETSIRAFRRVYDVIENPEKLQFAPFAGKSFSFDVMGTYQHPLKSRDVFIECKGYSTGGKLGTEYQEFLAKVYLVSITESRHKDDDYWFATNVPFFVTHGKAVADSSTILTMLRDKPTEKVKVILNGVKVDENHVRNISTNIAVCVLTDSYMKRVGVLYRVQPDDNLWNITNLLHGGAIPKMNFEHYVEEFRKANPTVTDPSVLYPGQVLQMPWYGIL